jgi:hypothetical protein
MVVETSTPGSLSTITLAGHTTGRLPFYPTFASGSACYYFLTDGTSSEWGTGTIVNSAGVNTLTRNVIGNSSGNTSRLTFGAGTLVYCELPAERTPYLDASSNLALPGTLTLTGAATLSSTLGVTGAATLSSTLGVTGAATLSSTLSVTGLLTAAAGIKVTAIDAANGGQFRAISGSYGVMLRNDGSDAYLLQTASGSSTGTFNSLRPFAWHLASGAVTIDGTGAGVVFGGAVTVPGNLAPAGLTVSGGATVGTTFAVTGTSNLAGAVTANGGVSSTGTITGGSLVSTGGLTVGSTASFGSTITAPGLQSTGTLGLSNAAGGNVVAVTSTALQGGLGYQTRLGNAGAYGGNVFNIYWNGTNAFLYMDGAQIGSFAFNSDLRIKHLIQTAAGALERVCAIREVTYRLADVGIFRDDGQTRLGFIAQEVQAVNPSAVNGDPDAVDADGTPQAQTLNPLPLIADSYGAIQQLTIALTDALARIAALEAAKRESP